MIVDQKTKAGLVIDANTASGNVTVKGAATINASGAGVGDTVTVTSLGIAAEDKKAVGVTTNAATVTVGAGLKGTITVDAVAASAVTVTDASGGATVTATRTSDATAKTTIALNDIDDSGATITAGASTKSGDTVYDVVINLDGTTGTADTATVKASGSVSLDASAATTDLVDLLTLSGNGAAVEYTLLAGEAGAASTKFTLVGDKDVTLIESAAGLNLTTVTDSTTAGTTKVKLDALSTADLSKVAVDQIEIAATATSANLTVANNANVILAANQTTSILFTTANESDTLNLSTGDNNGASTVTPNITTATLDLTNVAAGSKATVNIDATVGKLTIGTATTGTATTVINVKGTQDVALGTVTAKSVDATASSGKVSLTSTTGVTSVKTGTGADTLIANGAAVHNFEAGAGDDKIYIGATSATAQFDGGAGNDTITVATDNAAGAIVIVAGAGDDTVKIGIDSDGTTVVTGTTDAILVGGEGTDTLYIDDTSNALDVSAATNFAMSGFEVLDLTDLDGTFTVSAKQFAGNATIALKGTADDVLAIKAAATGSTIDASGVTLSSGSTATVSIYTGAKNDTVTGTAKDDKIFTSLGTDVIDGGAGTDTIDLAGMIATAETGSATAAGAVINLGTTAVSATTILGSVGLFTAQTLTSVAGGTAAYGFQLDAATNSAVVKTISNVENVLGTTGKDYIVGSSSDNVITGGAGADVINVGDGTDTIVYSGASDTQTGVVATGFTVSGDVVLGMGNADKINLSSLANLVLADGAVSVGTTFATATDNEVVIVSGSYDATTKVFTSGAASATNNDYVLQYNGGTSTTTVNSVVLVDIVGTLSAAAAGEIITLTVA